MLRNRIIGGIFGAAAAVILLFILEKQRPPRQITLLAENRGAITSVALQYTHAAAPFVDPAYRAFLTQIDPSVTVTAVCGDTSEADEFGRNIRLWKIARPERIHTLVVGAPITSWCRDRFLVSRGAPVRLIQPFNRPSGMGTRDNDMRVAPLIAAASGGRMTALSTTLNFDAGDFFPTDGAVYVNDELWLKNPQARSLSSDLERMFAGNVVRLPGTPGHHIAMFAAPLNDNLVMAGDPALGQALWKREYSRQTGTPDFSRRTAEPFQRAIREFQQRGSDVRRLPTVVLGTKVYISYTNAVFESRGSRRIVYMPSYDLPALDEAARRVYSEAGWEVRPIPVKTLYRFRGTIGCLINVLERSAG